MPRTEQICSGTRLFAYEFSVLRGTSRSCEDWVMDNILHSRPLNWAFGLDDLTDLVHRFQFSSLSFLASLPSFFQNWKCYKQYPDYCKSLNASAIKQWRSACLYSIDYRFADFESLPSTLSSLAEQIKVHTDAISSNSSLIYNSECSLRRDLIRDTIDHAQHVLLLLQGLDAFTTT